MAVTDFSSASALRIRRVEVFPTLPLLYAVSNWLPRLFYFLLKNICMSRSAAF